MRGSRGSAHALALAALGALAPPLAQVAHAQESPTAATTATTAAAPAFRELLAPYGMWVSLAPHGEVWVPREAARPDFVPYASGGRWVDGPRGLRFESTLPWGAVCFHHGRWTRPAELGAWAWIPGTTWAPSWVEWRTAGDRAAWRAMGPTDDRTTRPWVLARTADLGAPDLAARARVVDAEALARFSSALPHLPVPSVTETASELARPEPEPPMVTETVTESVAETPMPTATAGPGQVVLSGGGRIVVHERGRDRVIEVPPTIVARDSAEARLAEERRRAAIERQTEREREAAQRTQAIIARAETREREAREDRARPEPAPAATPTAATTVVTQRWLGGFGFGGYGYGAYGYGAYGPGAYGSVGFPSTPRRPTDAVTPGAASPRFDARLPFSTWRD